MPDAGAVFRYMTKTFSYTSILLASAIFVCAISPVFCQEACTAYTSLTAGRCIHVNSVLIAALLRCSTELLKEHTFLQRSVLYAGSFVVMHVNGSLSNFVY